MGTSAEWDASKNWRQVRLATDMKTGYVRSCRRGRGLSSEDANVMPSEASPEGDRLVAL